MKADGWTESPYCGLSDYWRIDRSSDRSREIASVLGGAATQAELVQCRLGGSRQRNRQQPVPPVILDPRLLSGFGAPVPSQAVDCLVGLAVREAALRSLSLDSSAWDGWSQLSAEHRREFTHVHRALEEAFMYSRLASLSKTLLEYLNVMRETLGIGFVLRKDGYPWQTPIREAVLGLWLDSRLAGHEVPAGYGDEVRSAVAALEVKAKEYMTTPGAQARLCWLWTSGDGCPLTHGQQRTVHCGGHGRHRAAKKGLKAKSPNRCEPTWAVEASPADWWTWDSTSRNSELPSATMIELRCVQLALKCVCLRRNCANLAFARR